MTIHRMAAVRAALALALLAGATAAVSPARAQTAQGAQPYTFNLLLGNDTLSSEVVQRAPGKLTVDLLDKTAGARWRYSLTLQGNETATAMHNAFYRVAAHDTVPFQTAEFSFGRDTVTIHIAGNITRVERLPIHADALPYINPSFAMVEQVIRRARAMGGAVDTVPGFAVAGGGSFAFVVARHGADSVNIAIGAVIMRAAVSADGSLLGADIPVQHVRVVRRDGAHPLRQNPIDYGPPPGAPYTAQDVTVHTPEGLSLTGTLTLPTVRSGRVPAVVTITGSGAEDRDERIPTVDGYRIFWQVADTLARRGMATLRLDDRGVNGSSAGPATATSADYANDIRAALAWLRQRPEIDGSRLALVGHSEGGMIAPMVAATDPALRGIVLLAGPAYSGRRILKFQQENAVRNAKGLSDAQRKTALQESARATDSLARQSAWMRFFLSYDPVAAARKVRVPVLILQGETDQQVTPEQADTLAAAFRTGGNRDVTERKFPSTDHLFLPDTSGDPTGYGALPSHAVRPSVLGALADWLSAHLR